MKVVNQHTVSRCYLSQWGNRVFKLDVFQRGYHKRVEERPISKLTAEEKFYESDKLNTNYLENKFKNELEDELGPLLKRINEEPLGQWSLMHKDRNTLDKFVLFQLARTKYMQNKIKNLLSSYTEDFAGLRSYLETTPHLHWFRQLGIYKFNNRRVRKIAKKFQEAVGDHNYRLHVFLEKYQNDWTCEHQLLIADDELITSDTPVIATGQDLLWYVVALGPRVILRSRRIEGQPIWILPLRGYATFSKEKVEYFNTLQVHSAAEQCFSRNKSILQKFLPRCKDIRNKTIYDHQVFEMFDFGREADW